MQAGKRIISLREAKGWNQRELAKRVSLNVSVMNRIELGERPIKDHELITLSDILDVSTDYLLGRTDNQKLINYKKIDGEKTELATIDTSGLSEYQLAVLEWVFSRNDVHFSKKKEDVLEMLEMFEIMYEKMKDK